MLAALLHGARQLGRRLRWVALAVLLLVLQWPLNQVDGLVREREARRDGVRAEVAAHFGEAQTVVGPVLTVPYRIWKTEEWEKNGKIEKKVTWHRGYAHFLPAELRARATVEPEVRRRGLFEIPVYTADLTLSGTFDPPRFDQWSIAAADILWSEAWLSLEVTDRKALTAPIQLAFGAETAGFEVGPAENAPLPRCLSARAPASLRGGGPFAGHVRLRGSERLAIVPAGGRTSLAMTSSWPHPSFDGAYLPERRTVTARGFEAEWTVLRFGRGFGQSWVNKTLAADDLQGSAFGTLFKNPTDIYSEVARSVRYAVLFLVMTFLVLYLWELLGKRSVHPLQYLLCGGALALFYVLELALAEHAGFLAAYAAAAAAIVLLLSLYARAILASGRGAASLGAMLVVLYAFLFATLRAEDHALLIGALGLLALLAAVMYATRRLNRAPAPLPPE